jgi:hypothetical protein
MLMAEILDNNIAGIYAGYHLAKHSVKSIISWGEKEKINNLCDAKEMHVTLVYSNVIFPFRPKGKLEYPIECKIKSIDLLGKRDDGEDKALVLVLESNELQKQFKKTIEAGAHWGFPEYIPHVTISVKPDNNIDIDSLSVPDFPIVLIYQYAKPIDKTKS